MDSDRPTTTKEQRDADWAFINYLGNTRHDRSETERAYQIANRYMLEPAVISPAEKTPKVPEHVHQWLLIPHGGPGMYTDPTAWCPTCDAHRIFKY